jgi:2-polyprenyl-3-methyl-5-hydroxy-6-metoxy-1,4-benzoquinol methylase
MNLQQRSYQKELLDADEVPFTAIKKNMQELNFINTWLGGHGITIKGFTQLLGNSKQITVCEIGCGGGDNLAAIVQWCRKKNVQVHCIGIDIKPECIEFAKTNTHLQGVAEWVMSDYRLATFTTKPGIIFSSLFCHHFTEAELAEQLQWMYTNSSVGFFINDLHRHVLAYHSIKVLTALFSSSYLVKNDAPLSVARGFTKQEWADIFSKANIPSYHINWQWAFRFLITCNHDKH